jgi:hypothetical protein
MEALTEQIVNYEMGELSEADTFELFSKLIKNGMAWSLQGHYGRTAKAMIDAELLTPNGDFTDFLKEELNI